MSKYYLSGCKDNGSETVTCSDEEAQFWTLYERDKDGLSQGIIDCVFREDAEAAMAVYVERDAHLAAEIVWEKTMMETIGEDGVSSVKAAFEKLKSERDALQEQVRALAAENVALKLSLEPQEVSDELQDLLNDTVQLGSDSDGCQSWEWVDNADKVILAILGAIKPSTPATDAVIREIQSQSMDEAAKEVDKWVGNALLAQELRKKSARIRDGEVQL